jgi:hypothetical protein
MPYDVARWNLVSEFKRVYKDDEVYLCPCVVLVGCVDADRYCVAVVAEGVGGAGIDFVELVNLAVLEVEIISESTLPSFDVLVVVLYGLDAYGLVCSVVVDDDVCRGVAACLGVHENAREVAVCG